MKPRESETLKQQIQDLINQQSHREALLKQSNDLVNFFKDSLTLSLTL